MELYCLGGSKHGVQSSLNSVLITGLVRHSTLAALVIIIFYMLWSLVGRKIFDSPVSPSLTLECSLLAWKVKECLACGYHVTDKRRILGYMGESEVFVKSQDSRLQNNSAFSLLFPSFIQFILCTEPNLGSLVLNLFIYFLLFGWF